MAQCRLVEEALDSNWVSATPLASTKNSDSPMSDHNPNNRPLRTTTMDQRPFPGHPIPPISTAQPPDARQRDLQPPPTEPTEALLATLNRDLTTAYDRTITSLTTTLLASASTHHTFLSSSLSRLSTELASQRSNEHSEISTLKQQIAATQSHGAGHTKEAELAQARAEGDAAGQQRAIRDMGDVHNGFLRSHLQELVRVRREARMEGYEAGFRAGVEQGGARGVREESAREERGQRLGSLFSEAESEMGRLKSEEYNPESEFGFQGHLGIIGGRRPVSSGEQRANDAEMSVEYQGDEKYNPKSEFQPRTHLGITGGRHPDSSGQKHPRDDDGELYDATPPRATKLPKLEHFPDNMRAVEEVRENTENRLILHKGPSEGLANSLSGGLFLSSDEEIDDGTREVPHKDLEGGFSYY